MPPRRPGQPAESGRHLRPPERSNLAPGEKTHYASKKSDTVYIQFSGNRGADDRFLSSANSEALSRPQKTMVRPTEQHSRNQTWGGRPRPRRTPGQAPPVFEQVDQGV